MDRSLSSRVEADRGTVVNRVRTPAFPAVPPAHTQSEAAINQAIAAGFTGSFGAASSGTMAANDHHIGNSAAGLSHVPLVARAKAAIPSRTMPSRTGRTRIALCSASVAVKPLGEALCDLRVLCGERPCRATADAADDEG